MNQNLIIYMVKNYNIIQFIYFLLYLDSLNVSILISSEFFSTIGLDNKSCNFICEVYTCTKSETDLYLLS